MNARNRFEYRKCSDLRVNRVIVLCKLSEKSQFWSAFERLWHGAIVARNGEATKDLGCEKTDNGTTSMKSKNGKPATSGTSNQSNRKKTNLEGTRGRANNSQITMDSTQNDTVSSNSTNVFVQKSDMQTATPTQNNRVSTEMLAKTSRNNNEKSCVNSNRLKRTNKNINGRSTSPRQEAEKTGEISAHGMITRSKARLAKTCHTDKSVTSGPKLGTISGSATDGSRSPLQNGEVAGKATASSEPIQDEPSPKRKFPALFGHSAPSESSSTAPGSATSKLTRGLRTRESVPLKIPQIPQKPRNPKADIRRFLSDYANKFAIGSKHTVDFFNGSFDDAQKESRNAMRLMLAFIHDPTNEDSKKFIHESLNSIEFDELTSRNQLIVWGVANDSEEGKYDIEPTQERRICGFTTASDLVKKLQESCDLLQTEINELRKQRERIMENRRLMQEQEKAYKESAERDKQKILEARKARQEKLDAEAEQKTKENEVEQRRRVIAEMRGQLKLQGEHQPIGNDLINVQVRFPSGKKFTKKFALDDNLERKEGLGPSGVVHKRKPPEGVIAGLKTN
ncbi:FAS-associated factor 2 [Parelaphostrongylus tenuis]|uniref:FAS-associated factor 2 n=1 Tax=Parelaphostrongylus tenuis TaxID=148309 RepID=A0AAD5R4S2_PARTN|nr:FAS-associated factor 2 [Parelaphostrongylus tenuis]